MYKVDRSLSEAGLERISKNDFQHTDHQIIFELVRESLQQGEMEPANHVISNIPMALIELVDELLARTAEFDPKTDKVLEDVMRALLNLRSSQVITIRTHMRYEFEKDQEKGVFKLTEQQKKIMKSLSKTKAKIDKAMERYTNRAAALEARA
ncbi:MAG: hypothetical protein B6I38_11745 [Anaerolineaceae bacterium 4572_5.1]|nr:MAG: hypothetical protein B6I38_11745 [Anaerolineaceae bacterium 4572_5.1]